MSLNFCSWLWLSCCEQSQLALMASPGVYRWKPMLAFSSGTTCELVIRTYPSNTPGKGVFLFLLLFPDWSLPPSPKSKKCCPLPLRARAVLSWATCTEEIRRLMMLSCSDCGDTNLLGMSQHEWYLWNDWISGWLFWYGNWNWNPRASLQPSAPHTTGSFSV